MGKGGGGSAAPSQQVVQNTTIPSYAQPYVETMLGKTAALTDTPYQQYGGQRIAGFTPLQTQAMGNISTMQVAPQLGQATDYATQAGSGMLGTTQRAGEYGQTGVGYGGLGAGLGLQAAGSGERYASQATNPYAVQAYMNPYIQASLAPQLQLLNQQQALQGANINARAAGQGAFGGNRAVLAQGLNAQNYDLARQQAIGQGYNEAFRQAQQAQQFGANLGLQGLQTGIQGAQAGMQGAALGLQGIGAQQAGYAGANQAAANLGQLGQTQYGQQMGINQAQMQSGALQQALQQQGLDVAYQDFLKQQNYPYQQLGFMSDMLRGLPLSQSAQQIYSAPPSLGSQLGGLGMTGLGIYGMSGGFRGAKGGLMDAKAYKEGGSVGYRSGGKLESMSDAELQALLGNPNTDQFEAMEIERILALHNRLRMNPETAQIMGGGLDTIPSGDTFTAAGGGIVAFAGEDGSLVKDKQDDYLAQYTDKKGNIDLNKAALSLLGQARPDTDTKARQDLLNELKEQREMRPYELLTRLGVGTLAGTSQYPLQNLGLAGVDTMNAYAKDMAAERATKRELAKLDAEGAARDDARRLQLAGTLLTIQGHKDARAAAMANAPSGEERAIMKVQALINQDDQIPQLIKQRDMETPGTPRYNAYNDAINSIKKSYFEQVGIKRPYVAPANVQFPEEPKTPGFFERMFGSSKSEAPAQNKVIPFSQLPS